MKKFTRYPAVYQFNKISFTFTSTNMRVLYNLGYIIYFNASINIIHEYNATYSEMGHSSYFYILVYLALSKISCDFYL